MKVLAIGDTHGNTSAVCSVALPQAGRNDCKVIIQVGDFGYWEHADSGKRFLDKVSRHLVNWGIEMWWLDGNHENHTMLREKYAPSGPYGFCMIRQNLWYMPRGTVFRLGDVTCMALGGAFSIDKAWRLQKELRNAGLLGKNDYISGSQYHVQDFDIGTDFEHTLWWPTEMITFEEAKRAIDNEAAWDTPVDIMFTHDCPTGVDVPGIHSVDKWKYPETWQNRDLLRGVFDAVQPKLLVHGHYHTSYTGRLPLKEEGWGCRVEGLSNDGRQGFAIVLDLDTLFPVES